MAETEDEMKQREVKVKSQNCGVTAHKINFLAFYCLEHLNLIWNKGVQQGTIFYQQIVSDYLLHFCHLYLL